MTVETVSVRAIRQAFMLGPFCPEFKAIGDVEIPARIGGRARELWRDVVISTIDGGDVRDVLRAERERLVRSGASDVLVSEVCDLLLGEYTAAAERVDEVLIEVKRIEARVAGYAAIEASFKA